MEINMLPEGSSEILFDYFGISEQRKKEMIEFEADVIAEGNENTPITSDIRKLAEHAANVGELIMYMYTYGRTKGMMSVTSGSELFLATLLKS